MIHLGQDLIGDELRDDIAEEIGDGGCEREAVDLRAEIGLEIGERELELELRIGRRERTRG